MENTHPLPIGPKTNEKIKRFYLIPIFLKATTSCICLVLLISMGTFFLIPKLQKKVGYNFCNISKSKNGWFQIFLKNQNQRIVKSEYFKNSMVCENGFFFCFNLFNNMGKYIKNRFFDFFAKCGYEPWVKSLSAFLITTQYWFVPIV
jgi:hypothetical protein